MRVGANESKSLYLLPEIILAFRARHPKVEVEIYRHHSERLPREVLGRNVDLALTANEPTDRDLKSFPVLKDELVLILPPNTRWRGAARWVCASLAASRFSRTTSRRLRA